MAVEHYRNIPQELKQLNQWVIWGVDKGKPKMPFKPTTLKPARAGDSTTWSNYYEAVNQVACDNARGIGFEFNGNGLVGVDMDKVIDAGGTLTPEAVWVVETLNSYTELSPSGTGLHIFVKADIDLQANRKGFIEMYNKERYFTVTGQIFGELKPIGERTAELQAVYDRFLKPQDKPTPPRPERNGEYQDDRDFLKIGLEKDSVLASLWNGDRPNGNESADDQALLNKLAYWCNAVPSLITEEFLDSPHFAQKDDAHKKKCDRVDYLPRTIEKAVSGLRSTAAEDNSRYKLEQARQEFASLRTKAEDGAPPARLTSEGYAPADTTANIHRPVVVKASEVPYEPPRWQIAPYFQRGKGTLIQADNGVGKTAFVCAIAAHVSTGRPLLEIPIETPGDVLILSVEDDLPVLRGRIEASGGNLDKCHFMTNAAGLTFNSPEVEQAVRQVAAKMVIFDPLQAFLGASVNMDKSNQTRPEFAKLFEMSDRNDCSIAIISHMGKGSTLNSAVNRSLGSVDIPAAMRNILHLARNPKDESECIAVHVKCSNAPKGRSISFTIGSRGGVQWNGYSDMTVEDLQALVKRKEKGIPYENEPLVQVFNQLIADKPGGGFWAYEDLKLAGMRILGFPPFADTTDLKAKLTSSLARELQERDGLIVTCGHRTKTQRGIRIEQYKQPAGYQLSLSTSKK